MREISPDELKRIMSGMSDEHYKTNKHVESWVTLRIPAEFVPVLEDALKTASNLVRCKNCKMWNAEWKHEAGDCYCYKFFQWTDRIFSAREGCERMGRLVDLDKVRELFRVAETCDKCQRSNIDCDSERVLYYTPRDICGLLDEAEEVDAVQVVRCKDCKWWNTEWKHEDGECYCYKIDQWTAPRFFCADGERREKDALD